MQIDGHNSLSWTALGGSIVLGSCAQISLKLAFNTRSANRSLLALATSPWLIAWLIGFAGATYLWIFALRVLDLSYAYPLLGLGYVIVTALAALFLGEKVSSTHWFAVAIITLGAACVAGSV
jgi:undecaprenyl phosphate-alpha-L-ara4N flippase subunit ArnE